LESNGHLKIPLVLRGSVHFEHLREYEARRGGAVFATPDVSRFASELTASGPASLADLYALTFEDILQYLEELGRHLELDSNEYLQEAFRLSCSTSGLPAPVLEHLYRSLPLRFDADRVRDLAEQTVGIKYLESWVPVALGDGARFSVRAFGARCVHVIAGNTPLTGATTIVRNAITRSDAIIKTPSNDPATAAAIARTMCEIAPEHPITRHVVVAYWKGGDKAVEDQLYVPSRIEKIVAWGGESSMRSIRGYIQPGLDLIALDPKHSSTFIGQGALGDEVSLAETAERLALDVGGLNQEGCVNARVVYVESGTDPAGVATLERLGELLYEAIGRLPAHLSGPAEHMDGELMEALDGLAAVSDWYRLIGARSNEGAVIVSQQDEPVDFATLLSGRVANLVPVDDIRAALGSITSYTQTIGVWPENLQVAIRDELAIRGAQRIVTLGHAIDFHVATPQDGMEPLRRMCKWIVSEDETRLPASLMESA
jgi:hypothetical protein